MQAKLNERDRSPRTLTPGDPMSAPLTDAARQRTSFLNSLFRLHYAERSQLESNFSQRLEEKSAESVFMGKQDLERVAHVIRQLPPKQREILLRSRFRGQTYDEIRQETGWSQADISRQLNKIMALLQAELDR